MGGIPDPYRLDPGPMRAWLVAKLAEFETVRALPADVAGAGILEPRRRLLQLLDWDDGKGAGDRRLYRWLQEVDVIDLRDVEPALEAAGVDIADIYPEVAAAADVELEPDAYCESCHEVVTPIGGLCPWCDRSVTSELPERMFCKREDAMSFPALDGNCWRCGGELRRHVPHIECGCGCGATFPRFDDRGRERGYVRGHAPRSLERRIVLPIEPFAGWLREQVRNVDPIEAVARRTGIRRDLLLAILNGHEETITSVDVRRSLWVASRAGQGKGMPMRPGTTRMAHLYPDAVKSTECPSCGEKKAKHAERCRTCAEGEGAYTGPRRLTSITDDQLQRARERREREGASFLTIAEELQPRTRMTNVESVKNQLRAEFHKRGWPTERLDRQVAA